jgi:hypothetical protein
VLYATPACWLLGVTRIDKVPIPETALLKRSWTQTVVPVTRCTTRTETNSLLTFCAPVTSLSASGMWYQSSESLTPWLTAIVCRSQLLSGSGDLVLQGS